MQTVVARYRVTTPLFMGAPAGPDHVELNLRGVKGAVRFWWRALNYARLQREGVDIRVEEARLFGAAAEKDRDYGAGPCKWRVRWENGDAPKCRPGEKLTTGETAGVVYLAGQGLMEAGRRSGELKRPCFWCGEPMTLVVELKAPDAWVGNNMPKWSSLHDALRLLGLLGGIGSRKSRGFGSISLESLDVSGTRFAGPADIAEYRAMVVSLLDSDAVVSARSLPAFPFFSAMSRVWLLATRQSTEIDRGGRAGGRSPVENQPLSLLNYVGRQMVRYRSYGRDGRTTLGEVPEWNFEDDHHWAKAPHATEHGSGHPRRIAFGMPQGYTNCDVTFVKPNGQGRRSSPLSIHVHRLGGGEHIVVATMLPARLSPDGRLEVSLRGRDREPLIRSLTPGFEDAGAWQVLTGFVEGTSRATGSPYFDRQSRIWPAAT